MGRGNSHRPSWMTAWNAIYLQDYVSICLVSSVRNLPSTTHGLRGTARRLPPQTNPPGGCERKPFERRGAGATMPPDGARTYAARRAPGLAASSVLVGLTE